MKDKFPLWRYILRFAGILGALYLLGYLWRCFEVAL